jgi:hypothetical protein
MKIECMYKITQINQEYTGNIWIFLSIKVPLIAAYISVNACSLPERMDYAVDPQNISAKNKPERPIGSIKLHMSEKDEPYAVDFGRISGGYQLYTLGPAFKNERDKTELRSIWQLSRDKYKKWFVGIKGSYTF